MSSLFEQLGSMKWDDLEGYKTKSSSLFEYSDSKIMVIMMGREINKRLKVSAKQPMSAFQKDMSYLVHAELVSKVRLTVHVVILRGPARLKELLSAMQIQSQSIKPSLFAGNWGRSLPISAGTGANPT